MDIVQRQRVKFTISLTLIAAIFLLVVLGGLFGIVYATNDVFIQRHLERALKDPYNYAADAPQDMQCIFVFYKDGSTSYHIPDNAYYIGVLDNIIKESIQKGNGKFSVDNHYFYVMNADFNGGRLYAIIDRTSYHDQLINTAVMVALLYLVSIVLVAVLGMLSSARLMYPVTLAMKKQRDFVANTSHELKTPLTIISSNISVIKSDPDATIKDNEEWISSIETQISRMQELIANMLELSKLEQSPIKMSEVDFSKIVEGECLTFDAVCFEKNITLIEKIDDNIVIMGDDNSLHRLVSTLLDNAIKYCSDEGKIGVALSIEQNKVHLSVMNTGQSISKEESEHVFDRFYRTDGARKNENKFSFGLGLSIAKATVLAHKGKITCHGYDDKGTVFDVYLPLDKKAASQLVNEQRLIEIEDAKQSNDH